MADRLHSALVTNRPINACKTNPPLQMMFYPKIDESVSSEKPVTFFSPYDESSTKKDVREIAISLEKRRPFKELKKDQSRGTYERQMSYFSEASALLQRERSARFQKFYQTELGRAYRYCYGVLVETVHQSPDTGSVTSVDYSLDGRQLAQGFSSGIVKVLNNDSNLTTTFDARKPHCLNRVTKVKLFGYQHLFLVFCNRKGRVYLSRYCSDSQDSGENEPDVGDHRIRVSIGDEFVEGEGESRGASKLDEFAFSARSIRMKKKTVPDDSGEVRQRILSKEADEVNKLKTIRQKQKQQFDTPEKDTHWKCHLLIKEHNELEALDVSLSSAYLITGGQDATVRLYDINLGKLIKEYPSHKRDCFLAYSSTDVEGTTQNEGHFLRVHALRFSDESENIFTSGGIDGVVKIWDTRAPHAVRNLVGPMICGESLDIKGFKLLCGQWTCKSSLELFDLRTFASMPVVPTNRKIGTLSEYPYCCKFLRGWETCQGLESVDGDLILSGHANCLEICSISEKKIVKAFPSDGNVISITNFKHTIVTGATDNTLAFYNFLPNEYAAVHVLNVKDFEPSEEIEEEDDYFLRDGKKKDDLKAIWTAKFGELWTVKKDDEFGKYVEKVQRVMKAAACDGVSRNVEMDRKGLLKSEEEGIFSVLKEDQGESGGPDSGRTALKATREGKSPVQRVLQDIDPKRLDSMADRKFVKKMKAKESAERIRQIESKIVEEIDGAFKEEVEEMEETLEFAEKPQISELEAYRIESAGRKKKQVSIMESEKRLNV